MKNLTTVTIPDTVTAIGNYTFYLCSSLESINIPESVTQIGYYAFRSTALTTATFEIPYGWSAGDAKYTSTDINTNAALLLKKSAKVVWTRDVNAEPDVEDVKIVASGVCKNGRTKWEITLITDGKYKLSISGNGKMPEFSTGEAPWYKTEYALQIVEIEIADGVTNVGRCSFYGLRNVSKVTLPSTVTAINDYGFYMCKALTTIDLSNVGEAVGKQAFEKTKVNHFTNSKYANN